MSLRKALEHARKQKGAPDPSKMLDDVAKFYKDIAGLRIDGKLNPNATRPTAWIDRRPNSMCMFELDFIRKPYPKGKWIKLLLSARKSGKSGKARGETLRQILKNRDTTATYNTFKIEKSLQRVGWIKRRLKANESRFGRLESDHSWSDLKFEVHDRSPHLDEPTLVAGAPGTESEGSHTERWICDDVVVEKNSDSRRKRLGVIRWWEHLIPEATENTRALFVGTRHEGDNLYEQLMNHWSDQIEVVIIPAWGPARDQNGNILWGEEGSEEPNYPWLPIPFLNQKRGTTVEMDRRFRMSYLNEHVTSEDAPFEERFLVYGEPPKDKEGNLEGLALYMLTDTAQTDRATKHTSTTALVIIGVEEGGKTHILDIDIGRYSGAEVQERFLLMYFRWLPRGLRWASMEQTGPGRSYADTIPQLALARGQPAPLIIRVPRPGESEQDARIGMLYGPFSRGEIVFSPDVPPTMFRIDTHDMRKGIAVEQLLNWSPAADTENDFPDALSDRYVLLKTGEELCPKPVPKKPYKRPLTDYEWSQKRAAGKLKRRVLL